VTSLAGVGKIVRLFLVGDVPARVGKISNLFYSVKKCSTFIGLLIFSAVGRRV
jgi:hypothetical protein